MEAALNLHMGDHTKREKRRQHVIEAVESGAGAHPGWTPPPCHCGAPSTHEVNRGAGRVTFVCREHLPDTI